MYSSSLFSFLHLFLLPPSLPLSLTLFLCVCDICRADCFARSCLAVSVGLESRRWCCGQIANPSSNGSLWQQDSRKPRHLHRLWKSKTKRPVYDTSGRVDGGLYDAKGIKTCDPTWRNVKRFLRALFLFYHSSLPDVYNLFY